MKTESWTKEELTALEEQNRNLRHSNEELISVIENLIDTNQFISEYEADVIQSTIERARQFRNVKDAKDLPF